MRKRREIKLGVLTVGQITGAATNAFYNFPWLRAESRSPTFTNKCQSGEGHLSLPEDAIDTVTTGVRD
jgi:hypothetical protein